MRVTLSLILCMTSQWALAQNTNSSDTAIRKSFKDWQIVCDRIDDCTARTASPVGQNLIEAPMILALKRDGFAPAWALSLITHEELLAEDVPVNLGLDGQIIGIWHIGVDIKRFGGHNHYYVAPVPSPGLLDRMVQADSLTVHAMTKSGKKIQATFSLKGLAASTLFIDETQNRLGSERVLAFPNNVKAAPDNETHVNIVEAGVPDNILKWHTQSGQCDAPEDLIHGDDIVVAHLSGTTWLYGVPCFAGAYNFSHAFYRLDTETPDTIEPVQFARFSEDIGWDGTSVLVNAYFDPLRRTLSAFNKYRGIGDCGTTGRWIWNGWGFKLVEYGHNGICSNDPEALGIDGPGQFPVVFAQPPY